jgi:hypothetical protein
MALNIPKTCNNAIYQSLKTMMLIGLEICMKENQFLDIHSLWLREL